MTLFNTAAFTLLTADTTPSLPDPATVANRTHQLVNMAATSATWSSVGATPFLQEGMSVATISVARGSAQLIYSNGTQWVTVNSAGGHRLFSATAVTNASGIASFSFSPTFAAAPVVTLSVRPSATGTNGHFCEVASLSASAATVQVWEGKGVLIGGQTTQTAGAGHTVSLIAMAAGAV